MIAECQALARLTSGNLEKLSALVGGGVVLFDKLHITDSAIATKSQQCKTFVDGPNWTDEILANERPYYC